MLVAVLALVAVLVLGGRGCRPSDFEECQARGGYLASRELAAEQLWDESDEGAVAAVEVLHGESSSESWCVMRDDRGQLVACDVASGECLP